MKSINIVCLLFVGMTCLSSQNTVTNQEESLIIKGIENSKNKYQEMAHEIWELAELGFLEDKSVKILSDQLKSAGFTVEHGVAGMPTSFVASYGSGKPIIGFLAEYDALPGMSQKPVPMYEPLVSGGAGHACGHHLFGTGSVAAAIAVKEWLQSSGASGTIRLYGTPAEEGGGAKIFMVREGLFDDVDAVLTWHPGDKNQASASSTLAAASINFKFRGIASHAAAAPERGRSALDGVEAMNYMVNMMREHIPMESRIHYNIKHGGSVANIVPAYAEVSYIIRHPDVQTMQHLLERVRRAAEAAALGTDTSVEEEIEIGYYNIMVNETLSKVMHANMTKVGGVSYDAKELEFANQITESYSNQDADPKNAEKIEAYFVREKGKGGSTDVGDISWVVPTSSLRAATWVPGTSAHSWQAVAAGGMTIGIKGMMVASKTLALSAVSLLKDPTKVQEARKEFDKRIPDGFVYECLVGDNPPPLNYRK